MAALADLGGADPAALAALGVAHFDPPASYEAVRRQTADLGLLYQVCAGQKKAYPGWSNDTGQKASQKPPLPGLRRPGYWSNGFCQKWLVKKGW